MAPVCWLMGVPWDQAITAGSLMGIKTVLNELIAYLELAKLPADALDARSRLIMLYAMCGFANFGSLGIMIAGLTVMAPERRADIISLGGKSIVSGTLTTCLMGAMVGVLNCATSDTLPVAPATHQNKTRPKTYPRSLRRIYHARALFIEGVFARRFEDGARCGACGRGS